MQRLTRYFLLLSFVLMYLSAYEQDLTGTWEGDMGGYEFLQLNILQTGDKLCGYSWDHLYNDKADYCKAYFTGRYDRKRDEWVLTGNEFIENSGSHILMRMRIWKAVVENKVMIRGFEGSASLINGLITGNMNLDISLNKVSNIPTEVLERMKDCVPKVQPKKDTLPVPPPVKVPDIKKEEKVMIPIPGPADDSLSLLLKAGTRKNKEQSYLIVHEKTILLKIYDNAEIDGDTVSIIHNGELVLSHQLLTDKAIELTIHLDEKRPLHKITLLAENLGSIPPNTALVIVMAGNKRYELFSTATLEENAVLVFEYQPEN